MAGDATEAYFAARVRPQECTVPGLDGPCEVWTRALNEDGYGRSNQGASRLAHRARWITNNGPVEIDPTSGVPYELDHLCRVRACAALAHLEPIPAAVKRARRGAAMTHCKHGHPFTGSNVKHYTRPSGRTQRVCRKCTADRVTQAKRRVRAK